ncbi:MAG: hypothetical protein GEV08_10100 [Acidimicrobiia bacterium]|nr:hypothetical protein [Acidimicrobiia bacterium]
MQLWAGDEAVLASEHVGDEFLVSVALPHRYDTGGEDFPVIVVLDAHWLFGTVRDLATSLAMGRQVPRALVVGVGYPTTDLARVTQLRQRDATPTEAPFPAGTTFGAAPGALGTGGAEGLRAFLNLELRPWLAERYRVRGPRVLVGHSMTALFGAHTLLVEPSSFDAYLLASPSLWWDERAMLRDSALTRTEPPLGADAYVSVGGAEDNPTTAFDMGANARGLVEVLRARGGDGRHRVTFEVLDGETHHSTTGQAVSRGLRALLSTPG